MIKKTALLYDSTKLVEDNEDCVILEVIEGKELDLIKTGCFGGNETMIRLTKGDVQNCTIWYKNGRTSSWHWGLGGYTLVTRDTEIAGRIIQNCIEYRYGIPLTWRHTKTDSKDKYFAKGTLNFYGGKNG